MYAPSLTTDLRYNTPGQDYSRRVIFLGEKYFRRFDDVGSSKKRRKERKRERRKKKKKKKGGGGKGKKKFFDEKSRAPEASRLSLRMKLTGSKEKHRGWHF